MIRNRQGQIIVEYMLLVVVAAIIAGIMVRSFARQGDDPASSGFVIRKIWNIEKEIGRDIPP